MRTVFLAILLLASVVSPVSAIRLMWNPSLYATGYRLSYGRVSGDYETSVDTGGVTAASISGLVVGARYYFAATAYNDKGESDYSKEVSAVIVETTPPTVSITSPTPGASVPRNSLVNIRVVATDASGIAQVQVTVDGSVRCTDKSRPYVCPWVVPAAPNRTYQLRATAVDRAGNTALSALVRVTSR